MKLSTLRPRDRVAYTAHARRVHEALRRIARKASPGPPPTAPKKRVQREQVQEKTDGNCHMCSNIEELVADRSCEASPWRRALHLEELPAHLCGVQ